MYAVGDLVAGLQLAHRGFAHGIFVAEQIAHGMGRYESLPAPVADREVPRVTYCDPEIASVGLGEAAAREEYGEVETLRYDLAGNGKSQILKTAGFVKLIRRAGGPVVGVHLLGSRVERARRGGATDHRLGRVSGAKWRVSCTPTPRRARRWARPISP